MRARPKLEPSQCKFWPGKWGWTLVEDYAFIAHGGGAHTIPAGFWFDGGSVPAAFWQLTYSPSDPRMIFGALPHDWCYLSHCVDRWTADMTLVDNLTSFGAVKAGLVKAAVRSFGAIFWRDSDNDRAYMTYLRQRIVAEGRSLARYGLK